MEKLGEELRYEKQLSREEELALKNRRTGMTIFQISWIMAFLCLVVVNLQIRAGYTNWPPEGTEPLNAGLGAAATLALVVSAVFVRRAVVAISHDDRQGFLVQLRVTLALGMLFVAILILEWLTIPAIPESLGLTLANGLDASLGANQYYSVFRMMTGFHGIHALAIGAYLLWVRGQALKGMYSSHDYWAVEAGAKLWYFVAVAWIIFYVVLYWI